MEYIKLHGSLKNMGAAEFKIICTPSEVRLVIHGHIVVARTQENVYEELFHFCKKLIESQ